MDQFTINLLFVGGSFALYIAIAIWARAGSTSEFYAAGRGVHPVMNGMATAADWMSAASFISMAGLIAFVGYGNSSYLMGWTGGYVLLALLLAPYLRKFGRFTVPDFIGDRFYSRSARLVAVAALLIMSITYVIGQMTGAGVAFSRFLEVDTNTGLLIGMTVDVNIVVAERPDALLVPPTAIRHDPPQGGQPGQAYVFRLDAGHARRTNVTLGAAGPAAIELRTELPPNTPLLANPPANLADGAAVAEGAK